MSSRNNMLLVAQKKRVKSLLDDDAKRLEFVREHLQQSDADCNQVLDEDEARTATKNIVGDVFSCQGSWAPKAETLDAVFRKCDRNQDGVLTEVEFGQFVTELLQRAIIFITERVKHNHDKFETSGFMISTGGIPLEDTNCARIGSVEDKAARREAAGKELAWKGLETLVPCLKVWRIEKFAVKPQPEEEYGNFYDGDSYIVYSARKVDDELLQDIFFWIGRDSTQDEYGTAAYKTVELDDYLGGAPVQHREVMYYESAEFKKLFEGTISYLKGGVESGFRCSLDRLGADFHRLLQVKRLQGKTYIV